MALVPADTLTHEWESLHSAFSDFHSARDLDGTWNLLRHGALPPDIPPELLQYAQGIRFMSGMLEDDVRILKAIHVMNPTRIDAMARGSTQSARDLESDHKLTAASWWETKLNVGRWLDDYVAEGQISHGAAVPWLRWQDDGDGCPVCVENTVLDGMHWQGDYRNPPAAWYRYSLSVIDSDIKNGKGERPGYDIAGNLGWVSEDLPQNFYQVNAGKQIDVIVRDAEDMVAMCPLDGCTHRKRRIEIFISKNGDQDAGNWLEVKKYDSPFERCSFMIVPGDIRHTERDPHRMFRPSAWVLFDLVLKYNLLLTEAWVLHRRELHDDTSYIDASGTQHDVLQTLSGDQEGGPTYKVSKPELGSDEIAVLAGPVRKYGGPTMEGLKMLLDEIKREYALRRPNPALTGQMTISEATGTAVVQQVQGAGLLIGPDLANWDTCIVRIFQEIRHGIRFTDYYSTEDSPKRYYAQVSGRENVLGYRNAKAGEEVYLDARKCEKPVSFFAETSKDTPSESTNRKMTAITGLHEGIYTVDDVLKAWDIFDLDMQKKMLFREQAVKFLTPEIQRRMAMYLAHKSAAVTGMDFGEEPLAQQLPEVKDQSGQTENTVAANNARLHAPPVQLPATGTPTGGSSGLGGGP